MQKASHFSRYDVSTSSSRVSKAYVLLLEAQDTTVTAKAKERLLAITHPATRSTSPTPSLKSYDSSTPDFQGVVKERQRVSPSACPQPLRSILLLNHDIRGLNTESDLELTDPYVSHHRWLTLNYKVVNMNAAPI